VTPDELAQLREAAHLPWGTGAIPSDQDWVPRWNYVHALVDHADDLLAAAALVPRLVEALRQIAECADFVDECCPGARALLADIEGKAP
jgi:hypothetical protein